MSRYFSTLNTGISETTRDRAIGRAYYRTSIGSCMRSIERWYFQWPWRTPNPVFKITAILKSNISKKVMKNCQRIVFINLRFDMIQVNIASLTELYHYGSLPEKFVSTGTVNCFKERLDRFWSNKERTKLL